MHQQHTHVRGVATLQAQRGHAHAVSVNHARCLQNGKCARAHMLLAEHIPCAGWSGGAHAGGGAGTLCGRDALTAGAQPPALRKRQQSSGCMHAGAAPSPPVQHLP